MPNQSVDHRSIALAKLLDHSIPIPGTNFRFGLDAVLGLIPGVGDVMGGILSTYIVAHAIDQGIPRATIARMVINVLIEAVVGAIPVVGDVFDAVWKANMRNVRLLESAGMDQRTRGRRDTGFLIAVVGGLIGISVAAAALMLWLLKLLVDAFA